MSEIKNKKPHSQEFFGEWRDFWWNSDFIELMAKRWQLDDVSSVLDVGCGIGHWGRVLLPHLPSQATVQGVDMESESVSKAASLAKSMGMDHRVRYQVARAEELPFADSTFDMVTCQTLLIHVSDVPRVIREMKRVLKPGGLLVLAEPNNAAAHLIESSLTFDESVEMKLKRVEFALTCERGKAALGLGHISIGDLLPGFCAGVGMQDIKVHLSDKATPYIAPYETPEQKANVRQALEWTEEEFFLWGFEETRRYFIAGGGLQEKFNSFWEDARTARRAFNTCIAEGRLHMAGGAVFYLISSRR